MFSTALADVTGTRRWLDCARERGWGLKTGTCTVSNTDNVGTISQADAIMKMKKGMRLRSHQGWCRSRKLARVWLTQLTQPAGGSWGVRGCCRNAGTQDWKPEWLKARVTGSHRVTCTDKLSNFQKCYFNALTFINVISLANSISLLYHRQQGKASIGWLWLPPAVWEKHLQAFATREQINQLLFVCSRVISRSCTT